jgi:hypothetical protein
MTAVPYSPEELLEHAFSQRFLDHALQMHIDQLFWPYLSGATRERRTVTASYSVVSLTSASRCLMPRLVSFCNRLRRLDSAAFAAEFIRSINRIPLR